MNRVMKKIVKKMIWSIGSTALMIILFYCMPEIQKNIADKVYRKM